LGPEDLPQLGDPGIEGLTAANIAPIRVSAITARAKKVRELRDACPKFLKSILSKFSVVSQLLIEADSEWSEAKAAENPDALVEIIRRTHFTHVDGATPAAAKDNLFKVFAKLEQGSSKEISLFKKEFDTLMRCWEAGGAPERDQEHQTLRFLEKLDKERHGSMLTVLKNNRATGMGFPATVDAA